MNIRTFTCEDYPVLEELLYEAIYQHEASSPLPREIIKEPALYAYIDGFGTGKADQCFVAEEGQGVGEERGVEGEQVVMGAVWVRIIASPVRGYGYVDEETPEFAIALFPAYRNGGIGTELMRRMIEDLRLRGYRQTSLSVDKKNYAVRMYLKLGFEVVEEREHDFLMLLKL